MRKDIIVDRIGGLVLTLEWDCPMSYYCSKPPVAKAPIIFAMTILVMVENCVDNSFTVVF